MSAPKNPIEYRRALGIRPFSPAWTVFIKVVYGIPLDRSERPLFREMSGGRSERPGVGFFDSFANASRGAGKDDTIKTVDTYECRFGGHEVAAAPGQRLPALVICPLRNQAQGFVRMGQGEARLPFNRRFVARETIDSVEFTNGTVLQVTTCDEIAVVGETAISVVLNEWQMFPEDVPIETNVRPALRRVIGAPPKRSFKLGSSYIKDGDAWNCFRDDFGRDDSDTLVVHGSTEFFNPNIDRAWLALERKKLGPLLYEMHYEGRWLDVIQAGYFPAEAQGRTIQRGQPTLPLVAGAGVTIAIDASFSENSDDKFGVAVASTTYGKIDPTSGIRGSRITTIHEAMAWKVEGSPREMAIRLRNEVCDRFGTRTVVVDQYSAATFSVILQDAGLFPVVVEWRGGDGEDSKAARYATFRSAMIDGALRAPDAPDLVRDIAACRSKRLPGGGEKIEVPRTRRGHGDCLSAAVAAVTTAMTDPSRRADEPPLQTGMLQTYDSPLSGGDFASSWYAPPGTQETGPHAAQLARYASEFMSGRHGFRQ